ncbi:hypothetical protein PSV09DRAFT_1035933, partial [Bipolaris maydis]
DSSYLGYTASFWNSTYSRILQLSPKLLYHIAISDKRKKPHLLAIGFTNSEITLTLLAGPISGLVIPVILAAVGDGSRRSSIIWGGLGVMMALLSFAWAQEISFLLMRIFDTKSDAATVSGAKFVAASAVYALNAAMQPLHISLRALLMDICQPQQQATASLWVMRFSATGSVLVTSIAFFSTPSFKPLSIFCCSALSSLLVLHTLEARRYYATQQRQSWKLGMWMFRSFASRIRQIAILSTQLPNITRRVCRIQLLSWFAWFPALFYMGSLKKEAGCLEAELILSPDTLSAARHGRSSHNEEAEAASAGAILVFHCAVLTTTIMLQMLFKGQSKPCYPHIREVSMTVVDDSDVKEYGTLLFRAWSLVLVASAFSFAAVSIFAGVDSAAALLITSMGTYFAMFNWAPYALLGIDLAIENRRPKSEETESLGFPRVHDELDGATAILTIHNAAICVSQIASAMVSTLFFRLVEKAGLQVDIAWVFLIVSPALLLAAWDRETWR